MTPGTPIIQIQLTNHAAGFTTDACFDWRLFIGVAMFVLILCTLLAPWPSGGMSGCLFVGGGGPSSSVLGVAGVAAMFFFLLLLVLAGKTETNDYRVYQMFETNARL